MRKFTFGNNGVEFTHDALITYQAMTYVFNLPLLGMQSKPSFLSRFRFIPLSLFVPFLQSPDMLIEIHDFFTLQ